MSPTPVVFIHGLWLHATSWNMWIELFREAGYAPIAPGWPGEPDTVADAREHPENVANIGINDVTGHYADIIDSLGEQPVMIGHSLAASSLKNCSAKTSERQRSQSILHRSKESFRYHLLSCVPDFPRWATRRIYTRPFP